MDEKEASAPDENSEKGGLWEFVKIVIISLLIVLPIRAFVAQPFIVSGASMEPNFDNGEYLIVDELSYILREPERQEVIIFHYPVNPAEFFIKRIIGMPGETVVVKGGKVEIKNAAGELRTLEEAYLPKNFETAPDSSTVLKEDEYFVLGDNRSQSSDSRFWGPVKKEKIVGRAFLRLWPVTKLGFIKKG
ncbi:signal peptidase I [Candidatus Giovannonibacteria bacterium]|nr:signal peptidase I [Candidatus Giovannonibacteria bacterium]